MKTNRYLTSILFTSGLLVSHNINAKGPDTKTDDRPNILFIIADDASYQHFGANGSSWVNTPGYDRVASEGINFQNCYTPNAKSAPSRASILTGLYAWQSGPAGNHLPIFPNNLMVFTDVLATNNYEVAFTGKGWAPGSVEPINGKPRSLTGKGYQSQTLKPPTTSINKNNYIENFKDFLNQQDNKTPWFFWFGCYEPHRSYEFGSGERLGKKNKKAIDDLPTFWPDNDIVRTDLLDYAYEIEYFDNQIVLFVEELEKRGLLDNTIVIVTSDHGMPFPRCKGNSYENSNHVPLAIMWKKGIKNPDRVIQDYINFVDLAPTFLELTKSDHKKAGMHELSGKSFVNIFKSSKDGIVDKKRDHVILGRERHDNGRPKNQGYPIRSIIKDDLLYIYNMKPELWPAGNPELGYSDSDGSPTKTEILKMHRNGTNSWYYKLCFDFRPEEELYDLSVDKDCINNLANHPLYNKRKQALKNQLLKTIIKQQDPRMLGNGDIFDSYPTHRENNWNLYDRIMSGELKEPWKQTGWINPTDYETYVAPDDTEK